MRQKPSYEYENMKQASKQRGKQRKARHNGPRTQDKQIIKVREIINSLSVYRYRPALFTKSIYVESIMFDREEHLTHNGRNQEENAVYQGKNHFKTL